MSLVVKSLNADTTFLLTFSPPIAPQTSSSSLFPGSFTVLIDPWLSGPSQFLNPKFQVSYHTVQPCIASLSELPEPDLVIISQDKPDHCHKETLCQLPPDTTTTILATPAAASKIRGWKHFDPACIQTLEKYDSRNGDSVKRIHIPSFSPSGLPGEVTVTNLPAKMDPTGLHNAIGITYRPPSSVLSSGYSTFIPLPLTPPTTPPVLVQPNTCLTPGKPSTSNPPMTPSLLSRPSTSSTSSSSVVASQKKINREKAVSVLYSPHGVPYSVIQPYAFSHLLPDGALPLTALFHSFNHLQNPWYLGGAVAAGAIGGVELAQNLMPRAWISAHDEEVVKKGLSVSKLKAERYGVEDIKRLLKEKGICMTSKTAPQVVRLDSGQEMRLGPLDPRDV